QGANGAAVLMRVALPAPGGKRLLDAALRGLAERHNAAGVVIDPQPSGPTAHLRVPGTGARKDARTPGRPLNGAPLLRVPDRDCIAPASVLERLASRDPRQRARRRRTATERTTSTQSTRAPERVTLDALRRYAAHWGIERERERGAATVLVLKDCP